MGDLIMILGKISSTAHPKEQSTGEGRKARELVPAGTGLLP